jgi:DNA repair protein RadD
MSETSIAIAATDAVTRVVASIQSRPNDRMPLFDQRNPPPACETAASGGAVIAATQELWEHQKRGLSELRLHIGRGRRRPMLQMATGSGKTRLAAEIIRGARGKGKTVAFIVSRIDLVDQTIEAFAKVGIRCVGVMQGQHPLTDSSQPVQIISAQTLSRRWRPAADLVIVDEAHEKYTAVTAWITDTIKNGSGPIFIGLSATPWTDNLGKFYDALIVVATTQELIDARILSDFTAFAPSEPDLANVHIKAGDYAEDELAEAMDKPTITGDIIETWFRLGENRLTVFFGVNRRHAQHVCERFIEAGVAAEYIDGETPREDRKAIYYRFARGETRVICGVGVMTTGLDLPMIECIILARPTKSRALFVQMIGRGLRTHPGKKDCVILDHSGTHHRLGRVTELHQDHLDDGDRQKRAERRKREESEPKPRFCADCTAMLPPRPTRCQACGAPVHATTTVRAIEGELVELGSRRSGEKPPPTIEDKAAAFGEIRHYVGAWATKKAKSEKQADGYAANLYRDMFGAWPNDSRIRDAAPRLPSVKTLNFITSRQIAYAKAKGRVANG